MGRSHHGLPPLHIAASDYKQRFKPSMITRDWRHGSVACRTLAIVDFDTANLVIRYARKRFYRR